MPRKRTAHRADKATQERSKRSRRASNPQASNQLILFGRHAVESALRNPRRTIHTVFAAPRHEAAIGEIRASVSLHISSAAQIAAMVPPGAVHQDIAAHVAPLEQPALETLISQAPTGPLLILDQVTDPHNIGAIFRSAAAFGAAAIVMQDKHAPAQTGTLARAASGALEMVPWISVVNLARALETLAQAGYWSIGLSGRAQETLEETVKSVEKLCLVLGAEGAGLRQNIEKHCDALAKLDIDRQMESLNVSNAAAVALYIARRNQPS